MLASACDLRIVSLRRPSDPDWAWLERSGGAELRAHIQVVSAWACVRGLLTRPGDWLRPRFWRYMGIAVRRLAPKGLRSVLAARLFASGAQAQYGEGRIDALHADFASLPATVAAFWAADARLAFSFCGHAFDVFSCVPAGRATAALLAAKVAAASAVFAANSLVRERLAALMPAGGEAVRLKRNGVRRELLAEPPAANGDGRIILVFLGELVAKKGVAVLLDAVSLLRERERFDIRIHGAGELAPTLRRTAAVRRLPVTFHGVYAQGDIPGILAGAAALVVPSVPLANGDSDGVPTVILEAAARSVPAVASRVGAIADFVRDEDTGWLVEPGDPAALAAALERVAQDSEAVRRCGRRARIHVSESFCVENQALEILRGDPRQDASIAALNRSLAC